MTHFPPRLYLPTNMSPALPFSMFAASAVSQKQPFCPTLKSVGPRQIYEAWSELFMLWIHCQQMALPINSHLYIVHPTGVIVKTRCTTNQSHQSELHQNEDRIVRIVRQLHLKKWNASQLIETSIMDQPGRSFNLTRILSLRGGKPI